MNFKEIKPGTQCAYSRLCKESVEHDKKQCKKHLAFNAKRVREKFAKDIVRRKSLGLCIFCEVKVWKNKVTCRKHTLRGRASAIGYYHKNKERLNNDPVRRKRSAAWTYSHVRGPGRFHNAKSCAKTRGHKWSLSKKLYLSLIAKPCFYCCLPNNVEQSIGLDRLDNNKGYAPKNVVSCCRECNVIRGNRFTPDEMKFIGFAIREIKLYRKSIGVTVDAFGVRGWA